MALPAETQLRQRLMELNLMEPDVTESFLAHLERSALSFFPRPLNSSAQRHQLGGEHAAAAAAAAAPSIRWQDVKSIPEGVIDEDGQVVVPPQRPRRIVSRQDSTAADVSTGEAFPPLSLDSPTSSSSKSKRGAYYAAADAGASGAASASAAGPAAPPATSSPKKRVSVEFDFDDRDDASSTRSRSPRAHAFVDDYEPPRRITTPHPPGEPVCVALRSIPECPDDASLKQELLNKLVILKLNGGLGTSMGCRGPKSALEVRQGVTFLDLTVRQVEYLNTLHGVDVPLILLNSFNTHDTTQQVLSRYDGHNITIHTLMQNCFPRINRATHQVIPTKPFSQETAHEWYPPGHGDVYATLHRSGMLAKLLASGKTHIFISNIDNLGASVDLSLLYHIMCQENEFCMEVTTKQRQDVQGGTLVVYDGKPRLVELSSVPPRYADRFKSTRQFRTFNTNSLWVDLRALTARTSQRGGLQLDVISNFSKMPDDTVTVQLETAAGSAIRFFDNVLAVQVSRERFLPVKTTSDLFVVQSNLFTIKHGILTVNQHRQVKPPVPTVKLGPNFINVNDYLARLPHGVPDVLELQHLTVSGDVVFGKNVALRGTVIVVAEQGSHIDVANGTDFEDVVVTGNLRVIEA